MKCDKRTIIGINAGGGDNRPAKIMTDIFEDGCRIAFIGLCINIKPFL